MEESTEKKQSFFRRFNNAYRLVFIDDESLEEVASYRITMRKIYIMLCSLFVLVAIVTLSLVMFTPLKYYIPGYAGGQTRSDLVKMKHSVDSLSDLVAAQEKYEANIRKVITGNMNASLDTTMLDLKSTHKEEMNSLLPQSDELMKQAAKSVKKENDKESNKKK
ncbi:MAG: hypothetical protein H6551_06440 [Chitinophagales bacterium]|nr:hypothetical protein [Chitinophagaceae bacterium]MCB9064767.1 hypothetical protein [Chitinophagales bacterium]